MSEAIKKANERWLTKKPRPKATKESRRRTSYLIMKDYYDDNKWKGKQYSSMRG